MQRKRPVGPKNGSPGPRRTEIDEIIAEFGSAVTPKLRSKQGSSEDHLRGPFESMLKKLSGVWGLTVVPIGEAQLPDLSVRPDYAVNVDGARVGYVELKKPGHGVPETWGTPTRHDKTQWEKLQLLPNVLYTDGQQYAHYNFGHLQGDVGFLQPALGRAGAKLRAADQTFSLNMSNFLLWEPSPARSLTDLVRLVSNLYRLLRDDIATALSREQCGASQRQTFSGLLADWRQALFPKLSDVEFADQYAQTVTFALLLARVEGVSFQGRTLAGIARYLGKKHSLMGRALGLLTDPPDDEHSIALTTMVRVLSAVDWEQFPDDSYALLYEDFLREYDPQLRRKSGVYYTPAPLVSFTTRFVNEVLQQRLRRPLGFAEPDVVVVDPAMGTGSFLAEIVNTIAGTISEHEGPGAVAPQLREVSHRLIGFENQAAPYAVAELRLHGLLKKRHHTEVPDRERRFLADTLDDPDELMLPRGSAYGELEQTRQGANEVKRAEPVMVVIGNPPYADKAKGTAPWIEKSSLGSDYPSLRAFRTPGNGRMEYVLSNKYVYFWRWATWKAFDAHPDHPAGVVAFVCSAGFLAADGLSGMREYLRRTADEGWIIDLSPEGHQPPVKTRFFEGNQQPLCVAVFIRYGPPDAETPAQIVRTSVAGTRSEKTDALASLSVDDPAWQECADDWTAPFQAPEAKEWTSLPAVDDLMPWTAPGVKPNRTWVYAPEEETLRTRWDTLVRAPREEKPELLKETQTTKVDSRIIPPAGMHQHAGVLAAETGKCPQPRPVGHRAFDRKWTIPDARVHHRPSPPLWFADSTQQVFAVESHGERLKGGPALVFSALIPDMHYHSGRGGRVLPLYRDAAARAPNLSPHLLPFLADHYRCEVTALDVLAYIAAVAAHSGYIHRFRTELQNPGVRIPITRSSQLWREAVEIGREVIWLHTYGERCVDPGAGRPARAPCMNSGRPRVQTSIPDTESGMPRDMTYDSSAQTLHVGHGEIAPVLPEVINYTVNGMSVVRHWFDYRKKSPAGKRQSELNDLVATTWTPTMTTELLNLLTVLGRCVELEPRQDELLEHIANGPLIKKTDLGSAGILPLPNSARSAPKPPADALFDGDDGW